MRRSIARCMLLRRKCADVPSRWSSVKWKAPAPLVSIPPSWWGFSRHRGQPIRCDPGREQKQASALRSSCRRAHRAKHSAWQRPGVSTSEWGVILGDEGGSIAQNAASSPRRARYEVATDRQDGFGSTAISGRIRLSPAEVLGIVSLPPTTAARFPCDRRDR